MNFPTVLFIGIIVIIVGILLYYFLYYRTQDPTNAFNTAAYTSKGKGNDTVANVPILTNEQVKKYLAENFTLSFYMNVTNLNSGAFTPDKDGNAFAPILWIVGVGGLVMNVTNGKMNMVFTSSFYDPANPVPAVQTVPLSKVESGLFVGGWKQVTLTMNGTLACIHLDGVQSECINLQNVPISAPTGVYFLQGQGPAVAVTSIQAWPISIQSASIKANYFATSSGPTESGRTPTNLPVTSFYDIGQSIVNNFCKGTGLCPPTTDNSVVLPPFTQINYEYA